MIAIPNVSEPKGCKECQWHLDFYIEDKQVGGLCTITEKDDKKNTCPLIDIVTCGECKYAKCKIEDAEYVKCMITQLFVGKSDFCSYGERRE